MNPNPDRTTPETCFLSNGSYFTFITAAGTGQSRRHGHVVNRWLGDAVEDAHGQFIYLRDLDSGARWSVGLQPLQRRGERYETRRTRGQFHITHECEGISAQLDVAVSPTEELEVRRLRLTDISGRGRRIEVTSYLETVLTWQGADIGHPAFSKLFLQTKFIAESDLLLTERRPRGNDEKWPCLFHSLSGAKPTEWETDRIRFLGRGRTTSNPAALAVPLSGTVGNVLDPCCSLRTIVELSSNDAHELTFITGITETRDGAINAAAKYRSASAIEQLFTEAEDAEKKLCAKLQLTEAQAEQFQSLAAALLHGNRSLRSAPEKLPSDADVNAVFGKHRIPRDRMQIIVCAGWDHPVAQATLKARGYWSTKGLFTNLIVLSDSSSKTPENLDDRVFTIDEKTLGPTERALLLTGASLVVKDRLPKIHSETSPASSLLVKRLIERTDSGNPASAEPLQFFNGYGGFSTDGTEYVIRLPSEQGAWRRPPLPWINVVANENAGFLVSESGAGCTWARNSQANRLTPWSNEPVGDPHGEAFYLRDEATGATWSPLPGPIPGPCDYEVRHGFGYSRFIAHCHEIQQETTLFVPRSDSVKIALVRLTNRSTVAKNLSITSYQRLVLGSLPEQPSQIVTSRQPDHTLRAVNLAAGDFRGGIAFSALAIADSSDDNNSFTCDRASFLGRYGTPLNPAALGVNRSLDGAFGVGLDPCFAQQRIFTIAPGSTVECVVLLGEAMNEADAATIIARYRDPSAASAALDESRLFWKSLLGGIQVETPSPILNLMVNGWLPYQTLCCRMWARTAFYQSSGAYGFRDQLQDSGSLLPLDPAFAKAQIRLHARHQFAEGDVLHWWHPEPIERGLRTRFSDDLLWLPFNTADYIRTTGDYSFLEAREPFLKAPLLRKGEDEVYLTPEPSGEEADIYEHCCRSIDRSLATGAHGLPLMGVGDWNDGMNRVGREGRGESVWVGFFLYRILTEFIPLCERRKDVARAKRYAEHRARLEAALNDGGWDGAWYRRAYYDNGQPLGSGESDECKIDALAQSWAVISKAAPAERADLAMEAMARELISEDEGLIRLLTPPFVNTANDPGYIKGYVAGVRENGGQYTHAACWVVKALAEHGQNNRALRLLEMLAPISHALTTAAAEHYKVEPYVVAADIYGATPHIGRGGWTWYTGSSGWMYRVAIESILGLRLEGGNTLTLNPCVPDSWPSFKVTWKKPGGKALYEIIVNNPSLRGGKIVSAEVDGTPVSIHGKILRIPLDQGDGGHSVRITLG